MRPGYLTLLATCAVVALACGDDGSEPEPNASGGSDSAGAGGGATEGGRVSGGTAGTTSSGGSGGSSGSDGVGGAAGERGGETGGAPSDAGQPSSAGAAGEGPEPEPGSLLPAQASGSRLRTRTYGSGDMPPVFVSFYDSELETDCTVDTASDGSQRCLPVTFGNSLEISEAFYLDDTCGEPSALGAADCAPAAGWISVSETAEGDCPLISRRIYRATQLPDDTPLYSDTSGDCVEVGVGSEWLRYSVEEAEPGEFVEFTTEIVESDGPLSVERRVSADGAFDTTGLVDVAAQRRCRAEESICLAAPAYSARDYRWGDPDCTLPVTFTTCEPPLYVIDVQADGRRYHEAGPLHEGPIYGGTGVCEEVLEEEGPMYEVGDEVDVSVLPALEVVELGSGRLRQRTFTDAAGTLLTTAAPGGLFDGELEQDCELLRGSDGRAWCVPWEAATRLTTPWLFSDEACSEPLVECYESDCPGALALRTVLSSRALCAGPVPVAFDRVYEIGGDFTGSQVYRQINPGDPNGTCEGPLAPETFVGLRELGPETDLTAFVELEEVVE